MADLNEVRLIGRLTRDPEMKATSTGTKVLKFGLATGRKYKGQDGVLKEDTTYVDITVFARLAEVCETYCKRGDLIFIGGRLNFEQWQNQEGQNRTKLSVIAENIQFLTPKNSNQQGQQYQQNQQYQSSIPGYPQSNASKFAQTEGSYNNTDNFFGNGNTNDNDEPPF